MADKVKTIKRYDKRLKKNTNIKIAKTTLKKAKNN